MNPKLYRKQIAEIGIEDMEIDISSLQNAMETMSQLNELEKVLNQIKFNIRSDIRNLRVEYMWMIHEADDLINKKSIFGKKKTIDDVMRKKKVLKKERDTNIAAYEIIENLINDYIKQIEESRIYIKNHIQMKVE
ncbi:MAG TPA: hypothetical protein PL055_00375 [Methanobacterium sp.]|jgi:hypothetical protein|nr:MAG: hypothetical protein FGO69_07160 [Methanobacterium sp.]HOI71264.1 hypothetical protein [Methanobacterium sp.]HPX77204.1 hypothetical protein [Methanobacterium sp.]